MKTSDVWITGVGTCTSLGHTLDEFADNLLAGRSFIDRVRGFDVKDHPSQIAGQLLDIPCPEDEAPERYRELPRLEQIARWCCSQALRDADCWQKRDSLRIGLCLGVGAEWLLGWETDGLVRPDPQWEPILGDDSMVQRLQERFGLHGPAISVSAACASGNVALAQAKTWLRMGWVDVCLAGATDAAVSPMSLAGFGNLRALSRRNDEPRAASRPFDRGRDGFVMGEGGAVFVLERAEDAQRRGAKPRARVAGVGAASDAHHMVIPSPDPGPATQAMQSALREARLAPDEVDYVNAHATSTPVGDVAESRVLHAVFGEDIHHVPVSSTKGTTGHLLTAAAAVEAMACIVAIERGWIPPTINLDDPDPECALCHVPHVARQKQVRVAVSNSFGFGGSNTCLVLRAA